MMSKEDRIQQFKELINQIPEPDNSRITIQNIQWLEDHGYFTAPASTKYHGAYEGGLFEHSVNVTNTLVSLTNDCNLKWERTSSPYIVGLFHDLCKIDNYIHESGLSFAPIYKYNTETILKGHGDKSIMLLSTLMQLTTEEMLCIRYHMGAFTDKEEWSDYTRAIHACPNVLWTHQADMIATHIWEVN